MFLSLFIDAFQARQGAESRRRLSYTPQCVGSESRLSDCSATDGSDSCDAPLLIRCYQNRAEVDQQPSTMTSPTLASSLSLPNQLVLRQSPSSYTSLLKLHPSTTRQSTFSTLTPVADAVLPSSLPPPHLPPVLPSSLSPPTTRFPSLSLLPPEVVIGAIGGVVVLLGAVILTFVVIFICRRRQRVKKPRAKSVVVHVYDEPEPSSTNQTRSPQPYQHPVSSRQSNISHQETNPRHTETTASSQPSLDSVQYHRRNHFPVSGTNPSLHSQAVISPSAHYDVLQRSRENLAEHQYSVLQRPREDIAEHQYSVLQRPREDIAEHQYSILQRPREDIAEHQYSVLQRPREDIAEHKYNVLQRTIKNIAGQYRPRENLTQCQSTENVIDNYKLQKSRGNMTEREEMNQNIMGARENQYSAIKTSPGKEKKNGNDVLKPATSVNDPMNFVVASLQQEAKPANNVNDPINFVVASLQQEAKPANSVNDPINFVVGNFQQESCSQPPTPSSGCSNNSLTTLL